MLPWQVHLFHHNPQSIPYPSANLLLLLLLLLLHHHFHQVSLAHPSARHVKMMAIQSQSFQLLRNLYEYLQIRGWEPLIPLRSLDAFVAEECTRAKLSIQCNSELFQAWPFKHKDDDRIALAYFAYKTESGHAFCKSVTKSVDGKAVMEPDWWTANSVGERLAEVFIVMDCKARFHCQRVYCTHHVNINIVANPPRHMRSVAATSVYIPPQDVSAKEALCKQELISDVTCLPVMFSDDPHAIFEDYQPGSVIAVRSPMPDHDYFVHVTRAPASYTAKRQGKEDDDVDMKDTRVAPIKAVDPKQIGRRQPLQKKQMVTDLDEFGDSEIDEDDIEDDDEYGDIFMDQDCSDEEEDEEEVEEDEEDE